MINMDGTNEEVSDVAESFSAISNKVIKIIKFISIKVIKVIFL